jgi:glycosyltransferase involved in cell wall biosynthesis
MLIIQANNIHEGGSKTLLTSFLKTIHEVSREKVVVFLDERFDSAIASDILKNNQISIIRVKPSLVSRLSSELKIRKTANENVDSTILCFGNIPPLFSVNVKVVLFFQTVLYFNEFNIFIMDARTKLKLAIEGFWIRHRINSVNQIIVQSSFIKHSLIKEYGVKSDNIAIQPFTDLNELKITSTVNTTSTKEGFFYPAIGTSHKNHKTLIDAWILLAQSGIFPLLIVTIDSRFESLLTSLESAKKQYNIKYKNLSLISRDSVLEQLTMSEAMIFPSLCESFGLPLLEARENNIQIIAGELDFVRDILDPVQTFDPDSALSISRAIKRFLKISEAPININSTQSFIATVLKK